MKNFYLGRSSKWRGRVGAPPPFALCPMVVCLHPWNTALFLPCFHAVSGLFHACFFQPSFGRSDFYSRACVRGGAYTDRVFALSGIILGIIFPSLLTDSTNTVE